MIALMVAVAGCALTKKPDSQTDSPEESRSSVERTDAESSGTDRITDGDPVTDLPIPPETIEESKTTETSPVTRDVETGSRVTETIPVKEPLVTRQPLQTVGKPDVQIPQPKLPETTARETTAPETEAPKTIDTQPPESETTGEDTTGSETTGAETGTSETGTSETGAPGTTVPETTTPETDPPTTSQPEPEPVRIRVAKRPGGSENLIFHDFYVAGVGCSIVYENSAAVPYGQVISVEFSGKEDPEHYYVDYGTKATLHVSTASGGDLSKYNDRIIYLTFDDGPSKHTGEVLDILATYNVRATFFAVGYCIDNYPEQLRSIYRAGHAIGCHSYSHEFKNVYKSNASMVRELYRWEDAVAGALGGMVPYKLFRFPGGTTTSFLNKYVKGYCKEDLSSLGYAAFDWSMASNDAWFAGKPADQTMDEWLKSSLKTTLEGIEKYHPDRIRVCLMHETNRDTRAMLPWALAYLSEKGYTFRTLENVTRNYYF